MAPVQPHPAPAEKEANVAPSSQKVKVAPVHAKSTAQVVPTPTPKEGKPAAPASNSDKKKAAELEKQANFRVVLGYAKREWPLFTMGMICLVLGQTADFISPLYIGRITSAIEKGEFDKVGPIVWQLFGIVFVSLPSLEIICL